MTSSPARHELPALVWQGGRSVAVLDVPAPKGREDWVRVQVAYAGLCGSDLHICAGEHSRAKPGIVLGHELAGTLAEPCGELAAGEPVFVNPMVHCGSCDACERGLVNVCERLTSIGIDYPGAMCAEVVVPRSGVYRLPPGLALTSAALVEPVAVGVRAVRRAGLVPGERVHVVGAGPIGCIVALLAQSAGAPAVTISEPAATRRHLAVQLGIDTVRASAPTARADVVFDATGVEHAAATVTSWARVGARIVVVGVYPPTPVPFDLHRVTFAELTVVGSRVYGSEDILAALDLVARGAIDVTRLITDVLPLREGVRAVDRARSADALKLLLAP